MIARRYKLKDRRAFRQLRQIKLVFRSDYFKVFAKSVRTGHLYQSGPLGGLPRIGITFAKGQVKKAVLRNRIKRRLEDAFREVHREAPERYTDFAYLIFRIEGPAQNATYRDFKDILGRWQAKLDSLGTGDSSLREASSR